MELRLAWGWYVGGWSVSHPSADDGHGHSRDSGNWGHCGTWNVYHAYRIIRSGIEKASGVPGTVEMMVVCHAFNTDVWPAKLSLVWVVVLEFHRRPWLARLVAIRVNASMLAPPLWVRRIKKTALEERRPAMLVDGLSVVVL